MAPSFKFDSQTAFLTYPHCDLPHSAIIDHLKSIKDLAWARVCSELHEDGQPHRHVVCKFISRVQSRNQRIFDVAGKHPNIQPIRSISRALAYVSKDGEFTDFGAVPSERGEDINWMEIAATVDEGQYYMLAHRNRVAFQYAHKFWELGRKHSCEINDKYEPDISRECTFLQEKQCPDGTVVLVGPSGCGKTSWAKRVCTKPALWVRHIDVLRSFRPRYHKSIIFDDMSFMHMPREAQIHIVDQTDEAHVHCRYGHAVIPANTQKIFTANDYPFTVDPAIDRRVNKIFVEL